MRRFRRTLITLLVIAGLASLGAVLIVIETGEEAVALVMGMPILVVSALTLWYALPLPARLVVTAQPELDLNDLLFFLSDDRSPTGEARRIPRDYLLQLHVAVANLGDRKGIVASLVLEQFLDRNGQPVVLPGAPERLTAVRWVQRSGYVNGNPHFENLNQLPPYVLDSSDAVTLRFRCRRGISWFDPSVASLRQVHDALVRPIATAHGYLTWRDGAKVHRSAFSLPVKVVQQQAYTDAIRDLTQGFTTLPTGVEPQDIALE
jgi:hypothetical protein